LLFFYFWYLTAHFFAALLRFLPLYFFIFLSLYLFFFNFLIFSSFISFLYSFFSLLLLFYIIPTLIFFPQFRNLSFNFRLPIT